MRPQNKLKQLTKDYWKSNLDYMVYKIIEDKVYNEGAILLEKLEGKRRSLKCWRMDVERISE